MALTNNTFQDIITLALKNAGVLGVGQTALAEDINDACAMLNDMIAQWQQRRYLVFHLVEHSVAADGSISYSIGPSGDINVVQRPAAINAAFARQTVNNVPNQIDYPISILPSRETYSQISMKSLQSFPQWAWYDAATPLGLLYVYPVITNQFTIHVVFREQLQRVESLTDEIELPAEYREALLYNLALRLSAAYATPINPIVPRLAKAALETMRTVNAQVPTMSMPAFLNKSGHYNIYSDRRSPS